jgi:outer membrane protein assembly factor BamB
MKTILLSMIVVGLVAAMPATSAASPILYGGLGGHVGDAGNHGDLVIVNQTTGVTTIVGHPAGGRIAGLVFGPNGTLFGSTQPSGGFPPPPGPAGGSSLIQINPNTGALISSVPIKAGGIQISIDDLASQPGTGSLFGIEGPTDALGNQGDLYTINSTTGVATLIGNTGVFFGSIAFAPNGTLYMTSANENMGQQVNKALDVVNPSTAAIISSVPLNDFFGALGIRPTDGTIFGGTGDSAQLFTINPLTGAETLIGTTNDSNGQGQDFVGDLAFQPVPEPASLLLFGTGFASFIAARRRKNRQAR